MTRWLSWTVKTKIKDFHCFRRPLRLKDVTPSYQTTMKTSEQMYFLSLVSIWLNITLWRLIVSARSEARDEGSWHGQPGEVRQLPDQAPEHLHRAGGRGGDCQAGHGIFEICSAEHLCSSNSNTHMSVVTIQCYIEFFLLKWKLDISIGKVQYNWFNFLDVTDLCDNIFIRHHQFQLSVILEPNIFA